MKMVKFGVLSLALVGSIAAHAGDVVITAGPRNFDPVDPDLNITFVTAKPGDTVSWKNMSTHNVKSIAVPDGAQPFEGKLSQDFQTKVDKPGAYVFECVPHASMGMVGVIVVGDGKPSNMDALSKSTDPLVKRMYKKLSQKYK